MSEKLYNLESHIWIKPEDSNYLLGVSQFGRDQLEGIYYVDLPDIETYEKEDILFSIESGKKDQDIEAPFTLEVIEVNKELEDEPEIVDENPEDEWIVKIKPLDDIEDFISEEEYIDRIKNA